MRSIIQCLINVKIFSKKLLLIFGREDQRSRFFLTFSSDDFLSLAKFHRNFDGYVFPIHNKSIKNMELQIN